MHQKTEKVCEIISKEVVKLAEKDNFPQNVAISVFLLIMPMSKCAYGNEFIDPSRGLSPALLEHQVEGVAVFLVGRLVQMLGEQVGHVFGPSHLA